MSTLKLIIAEDHELSRLGLSLSLQKNPKLQIIHEAESGQSVLDFLANENNEKPDLILMDIGMPILDGIETTQRVKAKYPDIKVLMLTSHDSGDEVFASLSAGAEAYCLKDIKLERLEQVIEMVQEGAVWLDPAIAQAVLKTLPVNLPHKNRVFSSNHNGQSSSGIDLTEREYEVLEKIVEGKSNKEIGESLFITIHTVKAHVCNIIQKLSVNDRTQAAVKALRDGLVKKKL